VKPRIGIAWPKAEYLASLTRAGAEPVELTPERDPLPGALAQCDGVLLTGGADVDPAEYGERDVHSTVTIDRARDRYELAIAREAIARDLPILAICRGAQVLNVAAGGTLVQDIPSQHPTSLVHSVESPRNALAHDIAVAPSTCLSVLLNDQLDAGRRLAVNSRHHQSVKTPAAGFVVSAVAPDGVIEAIEKPDAAFCLGVQWHPEDLGPSALFTGLVDAAKRRADKG
jgi:putative glutamine amidotransferase